MENELLEVVANLITNSDEEKVEFLGQLKKNPDGDEFKTAQEITPIILDKYKVHRKRVVDEGFGKAKRTINSEWEKAFSSVDGFKSESRGVELVEQFKDYIASSVPPKEVVKTEKREWNEEIAEKDEIVQRIVQGKLKAGLGERDLKINELKNKISSYQTKEQDRRLIALIEHHADKRHIIRKDDDADLRKTRLKTLLTLAKANAAGFRFDEDGTAVPLKADGTPMQDAFYNNMSFDSFLWDNVNSGGKLFTPREIDPSKGSPKPNSKGNYNPNGQAKGKYTFESFSDFRQQLKEADKADKAAITAAYKAQTVPTK